MGSGSGGLTLLQRLKQGSHAFALSSLEPGLVLQVLGSFLNLGSIKDLFLNAEQEFIRGLFAHPKEACN